MSLVNVNVLIVRGGSWIQFRAFWGNYALVHAMFNHVLGLISHEALEISPMCYATKKIFHTLPL